MKQTCFKIKTWGDQSQENNPIYQIEVYDQEYNIHSKPNKDCQIYL